MPDELRRLPGPPDPEILAKRGEVGHVGELASHDTLERDRWRWLAQTGLLTDDDRTTLARDAARSPNSGGCSASRRQSFRDDAHIFGDATDGPDMIARWSCSTYRCSQPPRD